MHYNLIIEYKYVVNISMSNLRDFLKLTFNSFDLLIII